MFRPCDRSVVLNFVTTLCGKGVSGLRAAAVECREYQQGRISTVGEDLTGCSDKLKSRLVNYAVTEDRGFSELNSVIVIRDLVSARHKIESADARILNVTMSE